MIRRAGGWILATAAVVLAGCTPQQNPDSDAAAGPSPAVKRDAGPIVVAPMPAASPVPPIGIPAPPFGIAESHTMYAAATFDFGRGGEPYPDAGNGPYTHYVDNTAPGATDDANPFGTADRPRATIPTRLSPGSVVEIHGGPYIAAETILLAQGTAQMPVFIRGINYPRFSGKMTFYSQDGEESRYTIIEGLSVCRFWVIAPTSYLAYRLNDVQGDRENGGIGIDSYNSAYANHHLVFYRNAIHDNGDWQADHDQDVHGICLARYTSEVWVLGNKMYRNSGDGLQINAGSMALQSYTHHIYAGRNESHHNKQAGLWCKQAVDVIFSQNTCHDLRPIGQRPSAFGAGPGTLAGTSTRAADGTFPMAGGMALLFLRVPQGALPGLVRETDTR